MNTLTLTLRPMESMFGLGEDITAVSLYIIIEEIELIRQDSELLVFVSLKVNKEEQVITVAQKLSSSNIIGEEEKVLPLEGTLWLVGKPEDILVESSEVTLYYIHA